MYTFRITFSTDIDEHYRKSGIDKRFSVVVGANTFREAEKDALVLAKLSLIHYNDFEIVSVTRLESEED